ncbi:MAG: MBOAT family O-acyltransferase [Eggerthellaceae bacterium]|jgi:alginate O-acetyltransferase complex protein AlgI
MVFSSLPFLCVFLPVVFGLCCLMPSVRAKNGLLIIASLLFYAYGEPVYVFLMIASTLANYVFGLLLRGGTVGFRKGMVALAVIVNLGLLGVFKYADFFVSIVNGIAGTSFAGPGLALPIGISFYTFQALSYVIDVYRRDIDAQQNYAKLLLYISFFPQLIAGPIVKYHDIAHMIDDRKMTVEGVKSGLRRFIVGLGKKVLIANILAVGVDAWYAQDPGSLNILSAWIVAFAYLFQIYYDFSGYSDMAIGMGRMFGFQIKENFNHPYWSCSIKEFWRRWHISLSTWFKEYLYIPLGGNRKGKARAALNRIIVFFLCGLWHGAAWTFVIWGMFHGIFLLLEEYIPAIRRMPRAAGHIYAIVVVTVGFVIFRADTIGQAGTIIALMFTGFNFDAVHMQVLCEQLTPIFVLVFCLAAIGLLPVKDWTLAIAERWNLRALVHNASYVAAFIILIVCLLELSTGGYNPFIYFRF